MNYRGYEIFEKGNTLFAVNDTDTLGVRARHWGDAAAPIEALDADGEWVSTPYQVADFQHIREAAIERIVDEYLTKEEER